ncbi:F-box only protein 31 isoform X2 [Rhipicephalus sanguineus]|uniref:F-box only protein 31 isoform X2 n=1 Tax=Rhipicephalus sanguineus TaxID=34632 RepID=UPI0020C22D9D|nr:F-box only protein 31 isoform X2 [Rhipicephalus sanguineus]
MESFPPELLAKIFSFLNGKDIASVAQVCRSFYEASLIENVWRTRCALEFAVKVRHVGNFVFKDIYTKLLHKYRFYLGLWQPQVSSYGGLFQVLISKDEFVFKCCDSNHHRHPNGKHQELRDWIHEETSVPLDMHQFPHSQELLLMKFLILRQLDYAFQYKRVTLQAPLTGVPIQPGIFKGTYGTHGLELIQLEYVDNCTKLRASKLSGDPNVPSGQVTFEVVLQYSMVLTAQQQASISALDAIEVRASDTPYNNVPTTPQPFRVPLGCHERFLEIPRTCIARYHGLGQVAGHGYTNPSFSRGHWVVFSEDLFGFLWLELLSLSMYHRVKEDLA